MSTRARMWAAGVATVIAILFVIFASRSPSLKLYPGDRTEIRDCRVCSGNGKQGSDRCSACQGQRRLTVIVPGPNHPTMVKGTVLDAAAPEPLAETGKPGLSVVPGSVKGARLEFVRDSTKHETMVGLTGRFKILLDPGRYKVHIHAKGYQPLDTDFEVAAPTEAVWQEVGKPVTPPEQNGALFRLSR